MKKLMVMLAAVTTAVVAQAASINWSVAGKTFAPSADDPATNGRAAYYLVYAFEASQYDNVKSLLSNGKIDDAVALAADSGRTTKTGATSGSITGLTGSTYEMFLVAFDTYSAADAALSTAKNYIISDKISGATFGETDMASSIDYTSANFGSGSWTAASVPEPTSGLLMLLGVAGLALRRRRA